MQPLQQFVVHSEKGRCQQGKEKERPALQTAGHGLAYQQREQEIFSDMDAFDGVPHVRHQQAAEAEGDAGGHGGLERPGMPRPSSREEQSDAQHEECEHDRQRVQRRPGKMPVQPGPDGKEVDEDDDQESAEGIQENLAPPV